MKVDNYMSGAATSVPARVSTRNSAVHGHFDQATVTNPTTKKTKDGSICRYCKVTLSHRFSTNLKNHLKSQHPEAFDEVQRM